MDEQIFLLGYASFGAVGRLERLMDDPLMVLVDIRAVARSRWFPEWNKRLLQARWGERYQHVRQLGNVNYKSRTAPVEFVDLQVGLVQVLSLLWKGQKVVLLCACMEDERCHRSLVAQLLVEHLM